MQRGFLRLWFGKGKLIRASFAAIILLIVPLCLKLYSDSNLDHFENSNVFGSTHTVIALLSEYKDLENIFTISGLEYNRSKQYKDSLESEYTTYEASLPADSSLLELLTFLKK